MLHLLSLIRSAACDVCNGAAMLGKEERRVREDGAVRQWPVPGRGQDILHRGAVSRAGWGDVVEEVRLHVDRDTADAAGHGGDPSRCPPPCPTTTKTGIRHLPGLEKGCRGPRHLSGAPCQGELNGTSIFPNPRAIRRDVCRCLSSRDLSARLKRCGMGFATQYWSGLSWISTRLASCCLSGIIVASGHSPYIFEIPIRSLVSATRHQPPDFDAAASNNSLLKKYPSAVSKPRRFCSGTNASDKQRLMQLGRSSDKTYLGRYSSSGLVSAAGHQHPCN